MATDSYARLLALSALNNSGGGGGGSVEQATERTAGIMKIATNQDALNGTNDTKAITPKKLNESGLATRVGEIEAVIPSSASEDNQLTDKDFVNSSVATNTAYFIGTFDTEEELFAYSGALTNNDYAFTKETDESGNQYYRRWKYVMTQGWKKEYLLNNTSFTAEQWASIQSGITFGLVEKLNDIDLSKYQLVIADLDTIRSGAELGTTALQEVPSDYVKNTDYATSSYGGVIKVSNYGYGTYINNGFLSAGTKSIADYSSGNEFIFISKGTLENLKESFEFTLEDGTVVTKNIIVSPVV